MVAGTVTLSWTFIPDTPLWSMKCFLSLKVYLRLNTLVCLCKEVDPLPSSLYLRLLCQKLVERYVFLMIAVSWTCPTIFNLTTALMFSVSSLLLTCPNQSNLLISWPSLSVPPLLPPRSPHLCDDPVGSHPLALATSSSHCIVQPLKPVVWQKTKWNIFSTEVVNFNMNFQETTGFILMIVLEISTML